MSCETFYFQDQDTLTLLDSAAKAALSFLIR